MSFYPTKDIIETIGMNDIGYVLKEEYKSIERRIKDIQKDKYIDACARNGKIQYLKYLYENGTEWGLNGIDGHVHAQRYLDR